MRPGCRARARMRAVRPPSPGRPRLKGSRLSLTCSARAPGPPRCVSAPSDADKPCSRPRNVLCVLRGVLARVVVS